MTMLQVGRCGRRGFTLVEMLVVLAIMGILVALIASATFQVIGQQRVSNTETLLKKLDAVLQRQWQVVVDQAQKEKIPEPFLTGFVTDPMGNRVQNYIGLLGMAGGNEKRARIIWIKLRLKQEFPQTFAEAILPVPPLLSPPTLGGYAWLPRLEPRPTYAKALADASILGTLPPPLAPPPWLLPTHPLILLHEQYEPPTEPRFFMAPGSNWAPLGPVNPVPDPVRKLSEPAACLFLALSQSRGGHAVSPDDLGTGAVLQVQFPPGPTARGVPVLNEFIDAWGNPIVFYRWPTANRELNPIGIRSSQGSIHDRLKDPLDPEGLLLDPTWNNYQNYQNRLGVYAFEMLCHSVHETPGAEQPWGHPPEYNAASRPRAFDTRPVLVSAGRNGYLGLPYLNGHASPATPSPMVLPTGLFPPLGLWPNPMVLLPPDLCDRAADNIYNYNLRPEGRGD